jgi:adenine-specific DNA-methyltransferase
MDKDRSVITVDGKAVSVDRDDPRVSEVRPFDTVELVGDATGGVDDNLLVTGDGADAMRALVRLPEYAERYRGKVRLAFLDPPFNTGQAFAQYDDGIEHSLWLSMMRDRLVLIRELLAPDGSVWVHLDDNEVAYCRVLMDEVFGRSNFIATVVWQRRYDPRNTAPHLSIDHDSILVFAGRLAETRFGLLPRTAEMDAAYSNPDDDPRGPWRRDNLTARNAYSAGTYPVTTPSGRTIAGPAHGTYWRVSKEKLAELDADGRIYWGKDGSSNPYLKRFLSEVRQGRVAGSVWTPKEDLRAAIGPSAQPFATPKPEKLLKRILSLTTEPGDIVLDPFAGSGTTAAVAHKMGRSWVTCEREPSTVDEFTLPRLRKVVAGEDPGGATEATGWAGGGGFRVVGMAPSIFAVHNDRVLLSREATNGVFAEGVRAQLGFAALDEPPFSGRKGRMLLAVVDGVVDENAIKVLVAKADGAPMTVVAKAHTDGAPILLKELSSHSILRKAPAGLLRRRVRGAGR